MADVVAFVIIPGIDGSDERHWQSRWERQWQRRPDSSAVRIAPASWSRPDLGDWVAAVGTAYGEAARHGDRVVLVAHSLGCWAASAWLRRNPSSPVGGAFLVAPPDPRGPAFPRTAAATFRTVSARPLPCPALVVGSSDDPYCTPTAAADFAARWAARWHLAGPYGHVNSASGLGAWPHGRALLDVLVRRGAHTGRGSGGDRPSARSPRSRSLGTGPAAAAPGAAHEGLAALRARYEPGNGS
ncbi:RBBP9/YdeN family alpha/beta hydrolase [Streptomyces rhizoryzae]|uniref:RBBP9/YdeN family alpha/beta hydrolase n=1 Tax=Streptomyces rhizoryzae TaxID=2932493 RepID=UPI0027E46CF4|nr:alpha/beta hydrolase [Streptomyces rhizoryzae]